MGLKKTPRFILLSIGYAAIIQVSYLAALLLRFEGDVPPRFWAGYLQIAPIFTLLSLLGFFLAGLYHRLWRYASTVTLFQVSKGVTLSTIALGLISFFNLQPVFPRSLIVMVWLWELVLLGGARFAWRLSRDRLLNEVDVEIAQPLDRWNRDIGCAPAAVGVHAELYVSAHHFTNGGNARDIRVGIKTDFDFHLAETLRNRPACDVGRVLGRLAGDGPLGCDEVADFSAEQFVDRLVRGLSRQVP